MRDFFASKGIRYELVGLHPKSHDMFWIYIKTTNYVTHYIHKHPSEELEGEITE